MIRHPLRLLLIGALLTGLALAFAWAAGRFGHHALTPQQIVDRQQGEAIFAGFRRAHAKGLCIDGELQASGALAPYSRASLFAAGATPFVGRFSIGGGNPTAPDLAAPVRSLALAFEQPDGQQWRTAMNTPPVLPVDTPASFYAQLAALKPDPQTGKPDPRRVAAFFAEHPQSAAFRAWRAAYSPSASFATERYHSINAFYLIDDEGKRRAVRWAAVPQAAPSAASDAGPDDALQRELVTRLAQGPVSFDLVFTFADEGDVPEDPSTPWPSTRREVSAGTLTVRAATAQQDGRCNALSFDPLILPVGMAPSADPILRARSPAYAISLRRRAREHLLGSAE
ncbi:MAG: catalase family peroxidase [Pseudomonadota bacterium]|nr:catalase family peroxidase [Pseudomonadota bacterium]